MTDQFLDYQLSKDLKRAAIKEAITLLKEKKQ